MTTVALQSGVCRGVVALPLAAITACSGQQEAAPVATAVATPSAADAAIPETVSPSVIVPMARTQLYRALANGKVDMVAVMVTVRPEPEKLAAFSVPTRTNVNEVVVTGPRRAADREYRLPADQRDRREAAKATVEKRK